VDGRIVDNDQIVVELESAIQRGKINRYYRDQQQ
jgi:hypothetical protein